MHFSLTDRESENGESDVFCRHISVNVYQLISLMLVHACIVFFRILLTEKSKKSFIKVKRYALILQDEHKTDVLILMPTLLFWRFIHVH